MPLNSQSIPITSAPHRASLAARALIAGVRGYQWMISPAIHALAGPGCGCRFTPTCSHYAIDALATHGFIRGTFLSGRRLLRCHPWGASGADPVPQKITLSS